MAMKKAFTAEEQKLRDFIEDNFDFATMKKMGFFGKDIKRTDYDKMAERICTFFGFNSIYEYNRPEMYPDSSFVSGKMSDKVTQDGELKIGGAFHLSLAQRDFDIVCPICECEQTVSVSTSTWSANKKCKGCKRKISILVTKEGTTVSER